MKLLVIDSGLGGRLIYEALKQEFKQFEIKLYTDSNFFPYGDKSISVLKARLFSIINSSSEKLVLLACNTLSSVFLKENLKFKKIVVDVITPTIFYLRKKRLTPLILATKNTIKMDLYGRLLSQRVKYLDASALIYALEHNLPYDIDFYLNLIPSDVDSILLGCTHLIKIKTILRERTSLQVISQDEILIKLFKNGSIE